MKVRLGLLAAAVLLAGGCTSTVAGVAAPAPGAKAVAPPKDPNDPCGLLLPEQLAGLGFPPNGKLLPERKAQEVPASCEWRPDDPDASVDDQLGVYYTVDIALEDFFGGTQPKPPEAYGGLQWSQYESLAGPGNCLYATRLADTSFAMVESNNNKDTSKACDLAKLAMPQVAAHLPGGSPAPPLTPKPKPAPSPLASVEPCDLLSSAELAQFQVAAPGRKTGQGRSPKSTTSPGCEWEPAEASGFQLLYVSLAADKSEADVNYTDEKADEQIKAGARSWDLFTNPDGNPKQCWAILPFSEKASVKITSGNNNDPAKACEQIRAAIPLISAKLPTG